MSKRLEELDRVYKDAYFVPLCTSTEELVAAYSAMAAVLRAAGNAHHNMCHCATCAALRKFEEGKE